ncbi:hypothetical protein EO013_24875 [Escherichia coli]|nr:hypothetical protein [Escherichia coli]EFA3978785.1 hypothetical protein [Escherichia coli]EFA9789400.1 hypothetical protein [Escherichia coli]EFB3418851.1 hypothetical protein [Escherichia coli]EFD7682018.1 hypothetical protein [Escherichia coli]
MHITEALISEPGDIRRFIQQAVDHWPHLLVFHFILHSTEGIYGQPQRNPQKTDRHREIVI